MLCPACSTHPPAPSRLGSPTGPVIPEAPLRRVRLYRPGKCPQNIGVVAVRRPVGPAGAPVTAPRTRHMTRFMVAFAIGLALVLPTAPTAFAQPPTTTAPTTTAA